MENYTVVGVRFKDAGKIYYFDPEEHPLNEGTPVIVETVRGWNTGGWWCRRSRSLTKKWSSP